MLVNFRFEFGVQIIGLFFKENIYLLEIYDIGLFLNQVSGLWIFGFVVNGYKN